MAELMLRRTRADQVAPVFQRFMAAFPDVATLAASDPQIVLDLVRPLGLSWRASAFQLAANAILDQHGGEVPTTLGGLLGLPGVGPYVAAAVMCFARGESVAVVDTNTVRVAGRFFGIPVDAESRRKPVVMAAVAAMIDKQHSRQSNFALLDLAALVCRPRVPHCDQCPLSRGCVSRRLEDSGHVVR